MFSVFKIRINNTAALQLHQHINSWMALVKDMLKKSKLPLNCPNVDPELSNSFSYFKKSLLFARKWGSLAPAPLQEMAKHARRVCNSLCCRIFKKICCLIPEKTFPRKLGSDLTHRQNGRVEHPRAARDQMAVPEGQDRTRKTMVLANVDSSIQQTNTFNAQKSTKAESLMACLGRPE